MCWVPGPGCWRCSTRRWTATSPCATSPNVHSEPPSVPQPAPSNTAHALQASGSLFRRRSGVIALDTHAPTSTIAPLPRYGNMYPRTKRPPSAHRRASTIISLAPVRPLGGGGLENGCVDWVAGPRGLPWGLPGAPWVSLGRENFSRGFGRFGWWAATWVPPGCGAWWVLRNIVWAGLGAGKRCRRCEFQTPPIEHFSVFSRPPLHSCTARSKQTLQNEFDEGGAPLKERFNPSP